MPYRRLPKTDQARIRALKAAVDSSTQNGVFTNVLSHNTYHRAKDFLERFSREVAVYKRCVAEQSPKKGNESYEAALKKARMYVSHFIQVLNLSCLRNEIKPEKKLMYKLLPDDYAVPDLSTEALLLEWGKNIIDGETERTMSSPGSAIYNPSIGKVKVHYELFAEAYQGKKVSQKTSGRFLDNIQSLRTKADQIILDLWNQIEGHFADLGVEAMQEQSKEFVDMMKKQNEFVQEYSRRGKANIQGTDKKVYRQIYKSNQTIGRPSRLCVRQPCA